MISTNFDITLYNVIYLQTPSELQVFVIPDIEICAPGEYCTPLYYKNNADIQTNIELSQNLKNEDSKTIGRLIYE